MPDVLSVRIESGALNAIAQRLGEPMARKVKVLIARRYSPVLWRKLVENSPVKGPGRTGHFAKAWSVAPTPDGGVQIRNKAKYAGFVEKDTRRHDIPKSGTPGTDRQTLRWRTGRRGPISAFRTSTTTASGQRGALSRSNFTFMPKVVVHPGTKGQRIIPRSLKDTVDDLNLIGRQETELVIREFIAQPLR